MAFARDAKIPTQGAMKRVRSSDADNAEEEEKDVSTSGLAVLERIVGEGLLVGYRAILALCDQNGTPCPYLVTPSFPLFDCAVLGAMGTPELSNLFRLFVEHRCGGRPFFLRMLRHFPLVDERVVDVFWAQTATMWQPADVPLLQQTAIVSAHPWLLRKLRPL